MIVMTLVVAAPWDTEDPDPPAAAETTTAPSDQPSTTNVLAIDDGAPPPARVLDSGYIAADPPSGFEVEGLYTTTTEQPAGWTELWSTPGASRQSGRWFAVQVNREGDIEPASGAERVELGRNGTGLLTHTSDGVAVLRFRLGDAPVTLTAGGWDDADVAQMATAMGHVGVRPLVAGGFTEDLELRWGGPGVGESLDEVYAYGDPRASVGYRRRSDDEFIEIHVGAIHPAIGTLAKFVLAEAPEFRFSGPSVRIDIDGRPLAAGILPGLGDVRVAQWIEDEQTVTVLSRLSLPDLFDIVRTVSGASPESWREAMMEARGFGAPPSRRVRFEVAGSGVLADGREWRLDVDPVNRIAQLITPTADSRSFKHVMDAADHPLHVFSSSDVTVLVAQLPPGTGAGFVLRVDAPAGVSDIPLVSGDGVESPPLAAYAFSELGAFSATLVAPDGTPTATISRGLLEPAG
jgi:hypothetical protein